MTPSPARTLAHLTSEWLSGRTLARLAVLAAALATLARPQPSGAADTQAARSPLPSQRGPAIGEVVVWPGEPLSPGGAIVVSAVAPTGARVTFDLGDATRGVPMAETSAGRYRGMLVVPCRTPAQEARVRIHLALGGIEIVHEVPRPLRIVAPPAPTAPYVDVTSPVNEQNVPSVFQVKGRTLPGAEVEVRATFFPRYILGLDGLRDHGSRVAVARANAQGSFAVPLDLGMVPRGDVIRIETRARADGRTSPTFRYEVQISDFH